MHSQDNPIGTNGFDFLEFTTKHPKKLIKQFEAMGFINTATHRSRNVLLYQQNNIRFLINTDENSVAADFANLHGPSVSAMGFRVRDAKFALEYAIANGAKAYQPSVTENVYNLPAIYGVGNSLIYLIDDRTTNDLHNQFTFHSENNRKNNAGLIYIDHVTHNLHRGNMATWADFYTRIFNFYEVRYFDIEGRMTGLKSKAMTSPCGKIRIPLNESSDDKSQIEEFLRDFNGEGIQHIALGTNNIYESVATLRNNDLEFLDTPDTYFELIDQRLPKHGEPIDQLKKYKILIDGTTQNEHKLLLQIFTKNMLGPVFFEIIQRKGDEGFGEGNFRALFESIELDQIRRGVIQVEEKV